MFTESFDSHVCVGDQITTECDGYTVTATVLNDHDTGIDDDDCHNVDQSVTGCNDEQQADLLAAREAYARDEWFYCGIMLTVEFSGVKLLSNAASLWGIEANYPKDGNSHLTDVANELLPEAIKAATAERQRIVDVLSQSHQQEG